MCAPGTAPAVLVPDDAEGRRDNRHPQSASRPRVPYGRTEPTIGASARGDESPRGPEPTGDTAARMGARLFARTRLGPPVLRLPGFFVGN